MNYIYNFLELKKGKMRSEGNYSYSQKFSEADTETSLYQLAKVYKNIDLHLDDKHLH